MTPTTKLAAALAVAVGLVFVFAFLRRIMRSNSIPPILDNYIAAFGMALLMTMAFATSLLAVGFSLYGFLNSVAFAGLGSLAIHLAFWGAVRLIVPIHNEKIIIGKSILATGGNDGGLTAG